MDKQAKINLLIKKLFTLYHSTKEENLEELESATIKLSYMKDLSETVYKKLDELIFAENDETAIYNYTVVDLIAYLNSDSESANHLLISILTNLKENYPETFVLVVKLLQKCLIESGDAYAISKMAQIAKYEDLFDASALFNALVDLDVEKVSACELIDII